MSTLRCENLDVRIGGIKVVDALTVDVGRGECWGLLGPNGIGKTTLLKYLAGLVEPRSGRVLLDGCEITKIPRRSLARRVGMLQQHTAYVFDSSVMQTALTGRHPHLGHWQREGPGDFRKAGAALVAVDLEGFAERSVTGLSGGEARRLAFATLLVQEPGLMLLDEPTNHLDLHHQLRIMELVHAHCQDGEGSALCALHDINLAVRYCSHVLMLFGNGEWCAGRATEMVNERTLERLYGCGIERIDAREGPRFHPVGR